MDGHEDNITNLIVDVESCVGDGCLGDRELDGGVGDW